MTVYRKHRVTVLMDAGNTVEINVDSSDSAAECVRLLTSDEGAYTMHEGDGKQVCINKKKILTVSVEVLPW